MTENLTKQIETTAKTLAQLEAEQADLSNKMTLAVNDADSASIISLRYRTMELPIEIQATKIRLERLRLQADEEKLPKLQAEIPKLYEPMEEARKAYDEAGKALSIASASYQDAFQNAREQKQIIADRKRNIERLMAEARNVKNVPNSLFVNGSR